MEKFIISGYVDVPLAELEDFREALALHIELTRQEPGCIVFEVDEDLSHPGRFTVYEAFVDQAAFDLHQEKKQVRTSSGTIRWMRSRCIYLTS